MSDLRTWPVFLVTTASALVLAVVVTAVIALVFRVAARRTHRLDSLQRRLKRPFRLVLVLILVWIAVRTTLPASADVLSGVDHAFLVAAIIAGAWLVGSLLLYLEDLGIERYDTDVIDNRKARRARTQALIVRRLTVAIVVIIAIASVMLTFPGVRAVGASVLASAGLVSVIAGLAAQSTLANVFAGLTIAFSDGIRVDDVVVVDTQWGRIEEITLTYVVVHLWDDRRLVLPSTYFTSQPFENWTRNSSELLGAVEFDLDWRVAPAQMRDQLRAILDHTDLWDGRSQVLQVTDAVGGEVHVRILVTAKDAPTLFDLRCYVREEMVTWLQRKSPAALPRTRVEMIDREKPARDSRTHDAGQSGLFSGTEENQRRATQFTGAMPIVSTRSGGVPLVEGPTTRSGGVPVVGHEVTTAPERSATARVSDAEAARGASPQGSAAERAAATDDDARS